MMIYRRTFQNIAKISFFFLLCLGCDQRKTLQSVEINDFINTDGTLSNKMIHLANQMNITFADSTTEASNTTTNVVLPNKSAEEFTKLIQGRHETYPNFTLRQTGKERWEMGTEAAVKEALTADQIQFNPTPEQAATLLHTVLKPAQNNTQDVHNFGMGVGHLPTQHDYEHILLLGTTFQNFKKRLDQLKSTLILAEQTPGFDPKKVTIFVISGRRKLNPDEMVCLDTLETRYSSTVEGSAEHKILQKILKAKAANNEFEMHDAQLAAFASEISPHYNYGFANEENITSGQARSSTESTISQYIKDQIANDPENWNKKNLLLVSSHIFGLYQKLITSRVLRSGSLMHKSSPYLGSIEISTSALEEDDDSYFSAPRKLAIAADNISRIFYEITNYKKLFNEYPSD